MWAPRRRIIALLAAASVLVVPVAAGCSSSTPVAGPGAPSHLTVDGLVTAVGVDEPAPTFSWQVTDPAPDAVQSAYRIEVMLGSAVVWDTGRVRSSDQTAVTYAGPQLRPDQRYSWTVQTWDGSGRAGPGRRAAIFDTGLRRRTGRPSGSAGAAHADWTRPTTTPTPARTSGSTVADRRAPWRTSRPTSSTSYMSTERMVDAGPAFSYPDDQYDQATDVTSLLRAGAPTRSAVLYHWYGWARVDPPSRPARSPSSR